MRRFLGFFIILLSCSCQLKLDQSATVIQQTSTPPRIISDTPVPTLTLAPTVTNLPTGTPNQITMSTPTNSATEQTITGDIWIFPNLQHSPIDKVQTLIWKLDITNHQIHPIPGCVPKVVCPNSTQVLCTQTQTGINRSPGKVEYSLYDLHTQTTEVLDPVPFNKYFTREWWNPPLGCSPDGKFMIIPEYSDDVLSKLLSINLKTIQLETAFEHVRADQLYTRFSYAPDLDFYVGQEIFAYTIINKQNQVIFVDPPGNDVPTDDVFFSPVTHEIVYGFSENTKQSRGGDIFQYEADKLYISDDVTYLPHLLAKVPESLKYDITYRENLEPWSPNGKYLAFIATDENPYYKPPFLCIITIATGNQECIELPYRTLKDISNPAWSLDSRRLGVFAVLYKDTPLGMDLNYDKAEAVVILLEIATSQITVVNLGKGIPNDYVQPKLVWR